MFPKIYFWYPKVTNIGNFRAIIFSLWPSYSVHKSNFLESNDVLGGIEESTTLVCENKMSYEMQMEQFHIPKPKKARNK